MYIDISEEEAHILILKSLGLDDDARLQKRGNLHVLTSPHKIVIKPPSGDSIFATEPCGTSCSCACSTKLEIPDDCFVVDPEEDEIARLEENLDGT